MLRVCLFSAPTVFLCHAASQIILISFSLEKDLAARATVTGRVRNSLIAMATSGTLGMEWCFMNRVSGKS